jgi:hypothetical protein
LASETRAGEVGGEVENIFAFNESILEKRFAAESSSLFIESERPNGAFFVWAVFGSSTGVSVKVLTDDLADTT